jgi:hypothetical protein
VVVTSRMGDNVSNDELQTLAARVEALKSSDRSGQDRQHARTDSKAGQHRQGTQAGHAGANLSACQRV